MLCWITSQVVYTSTDVADREQRRPRVLWRERQWQQVRVGAGALALRSVRVGLRHSSITDRTKPSLELSLNRVWNFLRGRNEKPVLQVVGYPRPRARGNSMVSARGVGNHARSHQRSPTPTQQQFTIAGAAALSLTRATVAALLCSALLSFCSCHPPVEKHQQDVFSRRPCAGRRHRSLFDHRRYPPSRGAPGVS